MLLPVNNESMKRKRRGVKVFPADYHVMATELIDCDTDAHAWERAEKLLAASDLTGLEVCGGPCKVRTAWHRTVVL
jgi:hypothetical protein